jgi:AcrR family transcriptional regulator
MKTRDRIILKMSELIAEKGYDKSSIGQVADAIGIKKASIYYYFRTKESILMAIFEEMLEVISIECKDSITPESYKEHLLSLSDLYVNDFLSSPKNLKVLMEFYVQSQRIESINKMTKDLGERFKEEVNELLNTGVKLKVFKEPFDIELNTQKIMNVIYGIEFNIVFDMKLDNSLIWKDLVQSMLKE